MLVGETAIAGVTVIFSLFKGLNKPSIYEFKDIL